MGEVWRARDRRLGGDVAIKVLPASFSADADRLRRFEQEAKAAGVLNHPNITAVYDIGQHDGAPYVVQELLEGETLRSALAGGKLSPRKAIDTALQIANGLAAAHEKGIVHRDLKPENLFVTKDGRVKILDFGLAKLTHQEEGGQATNLPTASAGTEPGVVMGTVGYMSPEQVKGKSADTRSDIFSFGAILYEMLSGQRAFHGDSAAETMSEILREEQPALTVLNQRISPGPQADVCDPPGRTAGPYRHEPEHLARPRADRAALDREESRAAISFGARRRLRPGGLVRHLGNELQRHGSFHGQASPAHRKVLARWPRCGRARGRALRRPGDLEREFGLSSLVQEAHVWPRARLVRPLRSRWADDRLCGVLGRRPETPALLRAGRKPRVAPAGPSLGTSRVHLQERRDAHFESPPVLDGIREGRHALPNAPVRERASGTARGRWSRGLVSGRQCDRGRPSAPVALPAGVSGPQGSLRDDRLDQLSADLSEGRRGRVSRSPRLRG